MNRPHQSRRAAALLLVAIALGVPGEAAGQVGDFPRPLVRVTDPRLAAALSRLLAGSATARAAMGALAESGLPVAVGRPLDLAALPDSDGGPGPIEREALQAELSDQASSAEPPFAWMVFRVARPVIVERAWVAVDVERIEALIPGSGGGSDAEARIEADLMVALAHELVAHVGSVAHTRRLDDFCDDPRGADRDGPLACSLRVENQVRRELNRSLRLEGPRHLPERRSYALDAMNFGRALDR